MEKYRAHSLFQPSNLAKAASLTLDNSGSCTSHLYGAVISVPHTVSARVTAVLGFEFVMIDASHTAINAENLIQLVQTINFTSEGKTVAVVRVPSTHSNLLTHALDAGASGIIFPHIDTPEEAAEAVRKCRYACSGGDRSLSPSALVAGITDVAPGSSHERVADANIAVICQIESPLAVKNADKIAAIPGVNILMVGAGDLRLSLGLPSRRVGDHDDPKFIDAINHVILTAKKYKKPLMAVAFKVSAGSDMWLRNFSMLISSADIISIAKGHQVDLLKLKEMMGK
ncbi:BgTH12-04428 [Blumeria graminis f. sp. triticale]|uniref:Bgt-633 n=3 Tax=Blumeria graminis TaxID=34373 RepID=A0A061HGD8_BLUGR|nr:hypothetical protein BGT96224_633 [Blumeria graminis f. sp. tritici 96224]CAD6498768.1 BgTH12-04428 [Blumeria graminis f. sp. triticale]VCU38867.1 Bgt-633 [Blumeria graminis f. sp. tritici]